MLFKKTILILIFFISYQTPLYSKSNSSNNFGTKNFSKYFSGIVAFENKDNFKALEFFNSSKILLNEHDPYLKRYIYSLILENKVPQAINIIKNNKDKENVNFFDAKLLLILDSLKKNDFKKAYVLLSDMDNLSKTSRLNLAILESLKKYIYVFKEKKFLNNNKTLGNLSIISETFLKCYLEDKNTDAYFANLFNDVEADYSRYIFFYLSYLIENNRSEEIEKVIDGIDYINSTLLLSQGKKWIESKNSDKLTQVFSCKNHNDLVSEFFIF
ncbi:MAG: hypothetical protein ACJZ4C_02810 [Candidatus Pelagibacter sp.]